MELNTSRFAHNPGLWVGMWGFGRVNTYTHTHIYQPGLWEPTQARDGEVTISRDDTRVELGDHGKCTSLRVSASEHLSVTEGEEGTGGPGGTGSEGVGQLLNLPAHVVLTEQGETETCELVACVPVETSLEEGNIDEFD
jgi:hypothetical protein